MSQTPTSKIPEADGPLNFSPRRLLMLGALFIGLTLLGAYAVYSQVAGSSLEWDSRLLSPRLLAFSSLLLLVYFSTDGLRLWFTLRALGCSVPFADITRLVFINIFASNITPLATGGGVVQVWFLRRSGVHVGTGLTATTIRTVLAVLFFFAFAPFLLVLLPKAQHAVDSQSILIPMLVLVVAYLSGFGMLVLLPNWLIIPLHGIISFMRKLHLISSERCARWKLNTSQEIRRFAHGFWKYLTGGWVNISGSILCTAGFLLSLFSFPALLFWALGYDFSYWLVVGRMLLTTFVMYFSPTPGASGIAEGVFGRLFADVVTAGHIVIVTVAWRILTIYIGMLVGLFITHRELSTVSKKSLE